MKVVCIDNISNDGESSRSMLNLVIHKSYHIIKEIGGSYGIMNEVGDVCYYRKDRFISIESYRNNLIDKLYD